MENFCYIDSICYQLKYFNRISMILSSICHVIVDHCQQRCHLQFTMVCAETEIGLGLDSENNNIWICIISGAAEIKKSRKRIFIFLAHLWGAYAIPMAFSGVRRPSFVVRRTSCVVCVHHNYQK